MGNVILILRLRFHEELPFLEMAKAFGFIASQCRRDVTTESFFFPLNGALGRLHIGHSVKSPTHAKKICESGGKQLGTGLP